MIEKWFWLFVLAAILIGGFALAVWYAKRQKAHYDKAAAPSTHHTAPSNFVPGRPHNGLPHAWTFPDGSRVYTDAVITQFGAREVKLADGSTVRSSGDVHLRPVEREWSLIAIGRRGSYVQIIKDSVVVNGSLTVS